MTSTSEIYKVSALFYTMATIEAREPEIINRALAAAVSCEDEEDGLIIFKMVRSLFETEEIAYANVKAYLDRVSTLSRLAQNTGQEDTADDLAELYGYYSTFKDLTRKAVKQVKHARLFDGLKANYMSN